VEVAPGDKGVLEMTYNPLALATAALMSGALTLGGAQAANVITGSATPAGITKIQDYNVQQVKYKKWYKNNWHNNNWHNNNNYYHYNHHHHHNGGHNGWGFGSGVFLGLGLAPFLYNGYGAYNGYGYGAYNGYGYGAYNGYASAHVRWCINHYRTYSLRSDTFIGYDGYRHRCRSPYRYAYRY
jgi:BA14K-like protein